MFGYWVGTLFTEFFSFIGSCHPQPLWRYLLIKKEKKKHATLFPNYPAVSFLFLFLCDKLQISEVRDINGNIVEEGKEPVHPSKLTLTEALAAESGGMSNSFIYQFCRSKVCAVNFKWVYYKRECVTAVQFIGLILPTTRLYSLRNITLAWIISVNDKITASYQANILPKALC